MASQSGADNGGSSTTEVFGHNTEILFRGTTYHVQTENIYDDAQPSITTLVYNQGRLALASRTSSPDHVVRESPADEQDQVRDERHGLGGGNRAEAYPGPERRWLPYSH